MKKLSRREFLKSSGFMSLGLLTGPIAPQDDDGPTGFEVLGGVTHWNGASKGRILLNLMTVYEQPSWRSKATGVFYEYDDVVEVLGAVGGEGLYFNNHTWLLTEHGYIYSSWVQPVENVSTNPVLSIDEDGVWGVVTVPRTRTYNLPSAESRARHWLYYDTVSRIMAVDGAYYLVRETYGYEYWVKAQDIRIIATDEIAPLSPEVPAEEKSILVSIGEQRLYAFEGENVVLNTHVATGIPATPTPTGQWRVIDKRHGQRMAGGAAGGYNLPAIPWVCYINRQWIATHGCYWHNDYGRRHSAGCINLPPEMAKWLFRWTTPAADYYAYRTETRAGHTEIGTKITIEW